MKPFKFQYANTLRDFNEWKQKYIVEFKFQYDNTLRDDFLFAYEDGSPI